MNLKQNIVLLCTLFSTEHFAFSGEEECVQRRLGACKAIKVDHNLNHIYLKDFQITQPEGFILKTSIEINSLENKNSFENTNELQVERKRKIAYNLDNAALASIAIVLDDDDDIRINGTFSVYADANTEPFLQYELRNRPNIKSILIYAPISQTDLIAFVDCSDKYKTNCGSHRVDILNGCREWFVEKEENGRIIALEQFQKTYKQNDVQLDEFFVVDVENRDLPSFMWLSFSEYVLVTIEFNDNSIIATLSIDSGNSFDFLKSVRTKEWLEIPARPYAIRVLVTNGTNSSVTISNIRGGQILSLSLCGSKRLLTLHFNGPNLYFDCLHPDNSTLINERPRKTIAGQSENITYHEYGYNFSKPLLDTRDFVSGPLVLYNYAFGNSTEDWCEGDTKPNVLVSSKYANDSLHFIIESSNKALLSQLERISAQNNATADTNKAIANSNEALLLELKKVTAQINVTTDTNKAIADSNKALLSELHSIKASIDVLATHLQRNTTSV